MQHSCCWLVIPGLCNEVSHDESQNGWQKTLAGISSTSCNTCLQICNFAACWLLAQPGWPFQGSAMRFCMAEARMDGKKTLAGASCNKLLQICNLQHSCCWLAIPGLCNEVSHGRSQNGWGKDPWRNFKHFLQQVVAYDAAYRQFCDCALDFVRYQHD